MLPGEDLFEGWQACGSCGRGKRCEQQGLDWVVGGIFGRGGQSGIAALDV